MEVFIILGNFSLYIKMQQAHFFLSFSSGMRMCSMSECLGEMTRACST